MSDANRSQVSSAESPAVSSDNSSSRAGRIAQNGVFERFARAGFVMSGIVHLLIGYLAHNPTARSCSSWRGWASSPTASTASSGPATPRCSRAWPFVHLGGRRNRSSEVITFRASARFRGLRASTAVATDRSMAIDHSSAISASTSVSNCMVAPAWSEFVSVSADSGTGCVEAGERFVFRLGRHPGGIAHPRWLICKPCDGGPAKWQLLTQFADDVRRQPDLAILFQVIWVDPMARQDRLG
ncbi:MAG: hypothetical protein JWN03_1610 [Nocardia sp.]|nr:hypothetical protein [Nocardia sp.]